MGRVLEKRGGGVDQSASNQDRSIGATNDTERVLAGLLAGVLRADRVAVESNFFDDLGADSLVMAHFCARVRKQGNLPSVSMKDIYAHPTIRSLAASFAAASAARAKTPVKAPVEEAYRSSTLQYLVCGVMQFLFFFGYIYVATVAMVEAYKWISHGSNGVAIYIRLVAAGFVGFLVVVALPILAKWVLIGRWKQEKIPVWSLAYLRFWIVKTLLRSNPCALIFVGSPLYVLYLRALGAKVGPGVTIFSKRLPVCTDLLTIGAGTVIRREAYFQCYRAHAGRIETGTVSIGRDAFIGEMTVLDINTSMGDGTQLGHASALHSGQAIPDGERWHGSPAQRTELNYLRVEPAPCGLLSRIRFCVSTLLLVFLLYLPLSQGGLYLLFTFAPSLGAFLGGGTTTAFFTWREVLVDALALSLVFYCGGLILGLPIMLTIPRLLNRFVKPDVVYPLYGFHDRLHRVIARMTTFKFFNYLFGDSSYIVHYLSWLGYRLRPIEQTGSNFGTDVKHNNPYLCAVGTGTMVADGLTFLNDEVSSTSFSVHLASIGPRTFVGNNVMYPAGGRAGDNCLLATKVMVPLDGEIREGVGLLGSPPFEIPRTVDRDNRFDHLNHGEALRRGLAAKNRYNLVTIGIFLLARWVGVFLVMGFNLTAFASYGEVPHWVTAMLVAGSLLAGAFYVVLTERCFTAFRPLKPLYCSIYDPDFWFYERVWKVPAMHYMHAFDGTPFKNLLWSLMGVRMGKRVLDDGVYISERTLAAIGDDTVLNAGSRILCHSQEDSTFKSDHSRIGAGCTVGVGALVHYGVTMGDGAVLEADSFLMKGEEMPARASWGGNPAREL